MQERKNKNISLPLVAVATGLILAAGAATAWWAKSSLNRPSKIEVKTPPPITQQEIPQAPEPITQEKVIEICWLNPVNNKIELVTNTLTFQKTVKPDRVLETAFETLLNGPKGEKYTTAIPEGTKLLNLKVNQQDVYINLSQEFTSGGGSASMTSRLAQVIYTATSFGQVKNVWISVENKPLKTLGQEGLIINQPMTREDFNANFTL